MKQFGIILSIVAAVFVTVLCLAILASAGGCAAQTAATHHVLGDPTVKGGSLHGFAISLDLIIGLGVIVVGALAGFYFTPQGHTLAGILIVPAGGIWSLSIFTRIVLPYGGIIAIVLGSAGLMLIGYKLYADHKAKAALPKTGPFGPPPAAT